MCAQVRDLLAHVSPDGAEKGAASASKPRRGSFGGDGGAPPLSPPGTPGRRASSSKPPLNRRASLEIRCARLSLSAHSASGMMGSAG